MVTEGNSKFKILEMIEFWVIIFFKLSLKESLMIMSSSCPALLIRKWKARSSGDFFDYHSMTQWQSQN